MRVEIIPPNLTADDLVALERAVRALERPSFAARLANYVGKPIDLIALAIPASARKIAAGAAEGALRAAARAAISSLDGRMGGAHVTRDRALLAASGAVGGFFGLAGLPVELPVSTVLLLRAIADSARAEGEDLSDPDAALNCLHVFAMGGRTAADDAAESGYFTVRALLAQAVSESAKHALRGRAIDAGAPALAR
ncbi:MAG: EcsC family protein, partial [Hyphomicrobiales bacterium]|nr:EcsC family protein [Hyphomicrobiales bacterium]